MSESFSPAADQRFRGSQAERIGNSVEFQLLDEGYTALWDRRQHGKSSPSVIRRKPIPPERRSRTKMFACRRHRRGLRPPRAYWSARISR